MTKVESPSLDTVVSSTTASSVLHTLVNVTGTDGPSDALTFNALDGDDTVDATALAPGVVGLTLNGGAGTDVLSGGPGIVLIQ